MSIMFLVYIFYVKLVFILCLFLAKKIQAIYYYFSQSIPLKQAGVWFRRLYDVPRRRSNARVADSLSDKGNLCHYADRAWDYLQNQLFYFAVDVQ